MLNYFFHAVVGICCTVLVVQNVVNQVPEFCCREKNDKKRGYALIFELECIKYCLSVILIPAVFVAGFPKLVIYNFFYCHAGD
jgi:hypothetical protein